MKGILPLVALAVLVGCRGPVLNLPAPESQPPGTGQGQLYAGFDRTDITPPAGYGLFGYGPEARQATGYRDRLYVRSMVLEGEHGQLIAIAVVNLDVVSTILQRYAAESLAARTKSVIGADRLVVAATHTHSGPAHFQAGSALNAFGSSVPGFDPTLTGWLAGRVASSVRKAYRTLAPARAAWGETHVWGYTRNRSYAAYALNSGMPARGLPAPDWLPSDIYKAVNPTWVMLRVDTDPDGDGVYTPAGAFSIFAIHGTVIPPINDLYDADIQGLVARKLERHVDSLRALTGAAHQTAVHLMANGSEGDVSPNWPPAARCGPPHLGPVHRLESPWTVRAKDDWEGPPPSARAACLNAAKTYMRKLGAALADTARRLFDDLGSRLDGHVTVARAFETLDLAKAGPSLGLCPTPMVGTALAAGAPDGRTRYIGWKVFGLIPLNIEPGGAAIDSSRYDCQRPKRELLRGLQSGFVGHGGLPQFTQLAVVRIGDMVIGTVPGEPTTTTGLRVMDAMRHALPASASGDRTAVLGLANGDLRYIPTAEEYAAQQYEGGSDFYGPHTADMIATQLARLTASLPTAGVSRPESITVAPGKVRERWPKKRGVPPTLRLDGPITCRGDTVVARWVDDPVPGDSGPAVAFERVGGSGRVIDDDIDVEVRAVKDEDEGVLWEARYTPPGGARGTSFHVSFLHWPTAPAKTVTCP